MKSYGIDDPTIVESPCFAVSRAENQGIIILVNQCTGDTWFLLQSDPFTWVPIRKHSPQARSE